MLLKHILVISNIYEIACYNFKTKRIVINE